VQCEKEDCAQGRICLLVSPPRSPPVCVCVSQKYGCLVTCGRVVVASLSLSLSLALSLSLSLSLSLTPPRPQSAYVCVCVYRMCVYVYLRRAKGLLIHKSPTFMHKRTLMQKRPTSLLLLSSSSSQRLQKQPSLYAPSPLGSRV